MIHNHHTEQEPLDQPPHNRADRPPADDVDCLRALLNLRAAVGFLGEQHQAGWWDTTFLSATGRQFLAVTFPRTPIAAGITSVTEAARRLHDERIGKAGVFHLFRLPLPIEEQMHRLLLDEVAPQTADIIASRETALERLKKLGPGGLRAPDGPVQIGTVRTVLTGFAVEELARHYHDAFHRGTQTFPYFAA
ncbi:MAG TPA: BrxE family protein [Candidatus Ozemobacteraceae bacterium]|nr:BrxE family protein [Candidatus Ozemobacteraceae bacterium]